MEISWNSFKPRASATAKKLVLEKDEQARIVVLSDPRITFVHSFEKVVTDERGNAIIEEAQRQDGTTYSRTKVEYAGKLRSLGDVDTLMSSGTDPENCPASRAAIEHPSAVRPPQPRYLVKVLKYNTKPGSWTPTKPFGGEILVWDLTEARMKQLKDIYDEHGDLQRKDLLLGPCESKLYQKYNIQVGGENAVYLAKENLELAKELIQENPIEDIEAVAGKRPSEEEMRLKVNEIVRAYQHAHGEAVTSGSYNSILESGPAETSAASSPASPKTPSEPSLEESFEENQEDSSEDEDTDEDTSLEDLLASLR